MRITNKIIQHNNLTNINGIKVTQDQLTTQMSTQKKISRPSDDPVVAIRALRLRSSVTEVTQYSSKNVPDANSWLEVTEGALKTLSEVVTSMISQCTKGSNGELTSTDRATILEQLKALSDEVYATGDADYAGRYVFTGYRTDTSLCFGESTKQMYSITEQIGTASIDSTTHVNTDELLNWNATNFDNATIGAITEQDISGCAVNRIRLSYDNCVNVNDASYGGTVAAPIIQVPKLDGAGNTVYDANGNVEYEDISDTAGINATECMRSTDTVTAGGIAYTDPYAYVADNDDAVVYLHDTGEILLGKNAYEKMMSYRDDTSTLANEAEFRITYNKDSWETGDLRPEHYFNCESEGIKYNDSYLTDPNRDQPIEYDVGYNQTIRVNTLASECFDPGIGREVTDLVNALQQVQDLDNIKTNIESKIKTTSNAADLATLNAQLDAVDKALTLAKDNSQKLFEGGITAFQGYLDQTNMSVTTCGTRSSKLSLIKTRVQNQKTTMETLKSDNEDIDITEVAINLSSAEVTYQAALLATGKISQTSLLNYI